MFTQSYQWTLSSAPCNQAIILNQSPLLENGYGYLSCVTTSSSCGGYTPLNIGEYCTDFSTLLGSSSGQISAIESIAVGSQFCVAFQSGNWIGIQVSGTYTIGALWSIGTCVNLTVRSNGVINTPPVVTIISPIRVPVNSVIRIPIPTIDADNDFIRCRFANKTSTFDECGGVCQTVSSATLDHDDCVLTFNSTGTKVGEYYAMALMIEDFATLSTPTPFSSVPLQFLITIVSTPVCPLKPTISSTLSPCTAIEVGVQFIYTLSISQGCNGTTVTDLFTMPPLYMYKGNITRVGATNVWTITETWTPEISQIGSQVYCALATDSAGIQSNQYCLTFTVVPAGQTSLCPGITTSTTSTASSTSSTAISTTTTTATTTTTTITTTTSVNTLANAPNISNNINEPMIIGLSLLGLGILLTLCCCCWWWLFCYGSDRRRNRQKPKRDQTKSIFRSEQSSPRLSLLTSTLPSKQKLVSIRGRHYDKHHKTHKSAMIYPLNTSNEYKNENNVPKYQRNHPSNASLIHQSSSNESLSTETNSEVEDPFSDADNIDKIDGSRLPSTGTMNVSIIKLPRATASAPIDQGIQTSKSQCSTSQTLLTNEKALLKFKQNNSTTINQRKSMPLNYKDTSQPIRKSCNSFIYKFTVCKRCRKNSFLTCAGGALGGIRIKFARLQ
ncbi:unnamed protein product [Adineta steineri]|uniref:Uncharacterized protein n=1 Tax=Adineta steineri TaxID=433720 RepID=A0A814ZFL9_9BILA|nr:unnamed protein product [Adineta steineri]